MFNRVLVTGGAGFIGSNLCEALLDQGREVLVLDNFNDFYPPSIKRDNVQKVLDHPSYSLVEGDIRDEEAVGRVFDSFKPQAVIHLAAMAGVRPSIEQPHLYNDVNIAGTTVLLEAVRKHPVQNFVFGSSSSVYGSHDRVPFSEEDVLSRPISPYAATKLAGEQLCFTYHHLFDLPVSCLRFFTVYGPRQRPEMAIHLFARKIINGDPITLFGDGSSRRDYTYVDDIIDGVIRSLDRVQGFEIFNLGESRTVGLLEMVSILEDAIGLKADLRYEPDQPGDVPITYADVSKAGRVLGYKPAVPIEEGIRRMVKWLKDQHKEV
ncbi:MAG: GDP-mannose 4,6-dehydratase [bacterium]|nr:GDP-mannose 4,6-dehydratase [bacterium]MDT8366965.1 GDP-mannose 4,6-dehydratase [bacterium]